MSEVKWQKIKQKLLSSFRLASADSGSAPTMDYAERPFGTGCVSHWSPRTPETIHSYAVLGEYTHTHAHTLISCETTACGNPYVY